jgi:hypothetical protein
MLNLVLPYMSKCFAANKLLLNLDRMNIIKFIRNNSPHCALSIGCKEDYTEETKYKVLWFTNL